MVSKASELLPDPDRPVTTVRVLRGMRTLMSRRLCWRAPRTEMCVMGMKVQFGNGGGFRVRYRPIRQQHPGGILLVNRNQGQCAGCSATIAAEVLWLLRRLSVPPAWQNTAYCEPETIYRGGRDDGFVECGDVDCGVGRFDGLGR